MMEIMHNDKRYFCPFKGFIIINSFIIIFLQAFIRGSPEKESIMKIKYYSLESYIIWVISIILILALL